jgi:hypothetical protein
MPSITTVFRNLLYDIINELGVFILLCNSQMTLCTSLFLTTYLFGLIYKFVVKEDIIWH